jgi:hypothetical protein
MIPDLIKHSHETDKGDVAEMILLLLLLLHLLLLLRIRATHRRAMRPGS